MLNHCRTSGEGLAESSLVEGFGEWLSSGTLGTGPQRTPETGLSRGSVQESLEEWLSSGTLGTRARQMTEAELSEASQEGFIGNLFAAYESVPLPPNTQSTRVLDIRAIPSDREDQRSIEGELRVINLDDAPIFTAISYVWGVDPPTNHYSISCGRFNIPVTAKWFLCAVAPTKETWKLHYLDRLCLYRSGQ